MQKQMEDNGTVLLERGANVALLERRSVGEIDHL